MADGPATDQVLALLAEICRDDSVKTDLDADLFGLGLMDSIGFIELLAGLQSRFGLEVAPTEVERSDMATPGQVLDFVTRRLSGAS